jgi:hypothetical protein
MRLILLWLAMILACPVATAAQSVGSPRLNFVLHCAGCHAMDGSGNNAAGVPNLRGSIGYFMRVDGGREYLAQVPGSSQSPLSDKETADLLNWMVKEFDTKELPSRPKAYSAEEVKQLRRHPPADVSKRRSEVTDRVLQEFGVDLRPYP